MIRAARAPASPRRLGWPSLGAAVFGPLALAGCLQVGSWNTVVLVVEDVPTVLPELPDWTEVAVVGGELSVDPSGAVSFSPRQSPVELDPEADQILILRLAVEGEPPRGALVDALLSRSRLPGVHRLRIDPTTRLSKDWLGSLLRELVERLPIDLALAVDRPDCVDPWIEGLPIQEAVAFQTPNRSPAAALRRPCLVGEAQSVEHLEAPSSPRRVYVSPVGAWTPAEVERVRARLRAPAPASAPAHTPDPAGG